MIVVGAVATLLALEFGVNAWLLTHGTRKSEINSYTPESADIAPI
jgi:hypothetical protein